MYVNVFCICLELFEQCSGVREKRFRRIVSMIIIKFLTPASVVAKMFTPEAVCNLSLFLLRNLFIFLFNFFLFF